MSVLLIDEQSDILTGLTIIDQIRWSIVDHRYVDKLRLGLGYPDPAMSSHMEPFIKNRLNELPLERVFLPITWVELLGKAIKIKYTRKKNKGFEIDFSIKKCTVTPLRGSDRNAQFLLIRIFRTAQSGQLYETANLSAWFKPGFEDLIERYSNAIKKITCGL